MGWNHQPVEACFVWMFLLGGFFQLHPQQLTQGDLQKVGRPRLDRTHDMFRGFHHDLLGDSSLVTLKLDKMVANLGGGGFVFIVYFHPDWLGEMIQFDWRIYFSDGWGLKPPRSNKIGATFLFNGALLTQVSWSPLRLAGSFLWWLEGSHRMHHISRTIHTVDGRNPKQPPGIYIYITL